MTKFADNNNLSATEQKFHNRMVVYLMYGAVGDLRLDSNGDLYHMSCDDILFGEAMTAAQRKSAILARMTYNSATKGAGWILTRYGAEWILGNLPPESVSDRRRIVAIYSA